MVICFMRTRKTRYSLELIAVILNVPAAVLSTENGSRKKKRRAKQVWLLHLLIAVVIYILY